MEVGKCYKNKREEFIKVIDIRTFDKMTQIRALECNPATYGSDIVIGIRIDLVESEWTQVTYDDFKAAAQSNLDKLLKVGEWEVY